jgi:hypothetical protein
MKANTARILNRKPIDYLFDHVIDGFALTRKGLRQALDDKVITLEEYWQLVEANQDRVLDRIKQFKIVNKLLSLLFACIFSYLQVNGDQLDMRRSGRRRNENEKTKLICT